MENDAALLIFQHLNAALQLHQFGGCCGDGSGEKELRLGDGDAVAEAAAVSGVVQDVYLKLFAICEISDTEEAPPSSWMMNPFVASVSPVARIVATLAT